MVSKRNNQGILWADKEFIRWLKQVKAKKQLNGEVGDVMASLNLGEITRQILNTDAIKEVEKQLTMDKKRVDLKIKLDRRRMLG